MYSSQTEKERWESLHGPWELYIIDSGVHGIDSSVDRFMYTDAVKHLGRKTDTTVWYPLPPATGDRPAPPTHVLHEDAHVTDDTRVPSDYEDQVVQLFWSQWDDIARQRDMLLASRIVDWDAIADTIIASNKLLHYAPDRSLRQLARLSKLPLSWDPRQPARLIYVVYGPFPPYVGQTGLLQAHTHSWNATASTYGERNH